MTEIGFISLIRISYLRNNKNKEFEGEMESTMNLKKTVSWERQKTKILN